MIFEWKTQQLHLAGFRWVTFPIVSSLHFENHMRFVLLGRMIPVRGKLASKRKHATPSPHNGRDRLCGRAAAENGL